MQRNITSYFPAYIMLPLMLLLSIWCIAKSISYQGADSLMSLALTLDFIVTIPLVYYFLIRKKAISNVTVISVFVVCILLAGVVLPPDQQFWLMKVRQFAIPLAELFLLVFVIRQFVKTRKAFHAQKNRLERQDFYDTLKSACNEVLPKPLASVVSMEASVIYYSFFVWSKPKLGENDFSYHKKSGIALILGTFMGIIVVETFAAHLLLERWNTTVAWVITILSIYTLLQFFALIRSLPLRPIQLVGDELLMRYGFFSEINVPLSAVEDIKCTSRSWPEDADIVQLSPLGSLASHNVILYFNTELSLSGFYGKEKKCKALALFIDDKERFVDLLKNKGCSDK